MHQFFTPNGRFLARVEGPVSGNVLLRRQQYRVSDDPGAVRPLCEISSWESCITSAWYWGVPCVTMATSCRTIKSPLWRMPTSAWNESLTSCKRKMPTWICCGGMRGEAAQAYFGVFDGMIRVDSPAMRFHGRSRRPPRDAVNALLSFLYTLVTHDCRSALESVGLDPAVGFCTGTDRGAQAWRWICWRSSDRCWRIVWRYR